VGGVKGGVRSVARHAVVQRDWKFHMKWSGTTVQSVCSDAMETHE